MEKPLIKFFLLIFLIVTVLQNIKSQDISTGLVAHYEFENTTGDVIDAAGSHNGTNNGATRGIVGKIGNAFSFDGSDYITINNHSDISNYSEFTLSAWIYPTAPGSIQNILVKVNSGRDFVMQMSSSLKLNAHFYDGGYKHCYSTTSIQANQWIHTLCTWKNNEWKIYYNGILESSCSFTGYDPPWISSNMYIGALSSGSEKFVGLIDEVRIYNRALSSNDVSTLYNYTGSGSSPALSVNNISVNEDIGSATFTISLNQSTPQTISGNYSTSDETASEGSDYISTNGIFTIPANQMSTIIDVPIIDDSAIENIETFNLNLSNPVNATIVNGAGTCTVTDNDDTGTLECSSTITSFPYNEGFENSSNTWGNTTGDDTDWTRHTGATTSYYTGPSSAYEGNYYSYIESSSPNYPTKTAIILGPCFDLSGQSTAEFSFYYHMYGAAMGTLKLEASTNGITWNTLWIISGDQGDSWNQQTVNLSSYAGNTITLRFYGTTGSSYTSDIVVDNLSLTTTPAGGNSFWAQNGTNIYPTNSGNVGIGTLSPDEKLTVNGTIHSEEVIIDLSIPAPDYVFEPEYKLLSIAELEDFIEKNSHLPEFPPASEMETAGMTLSEMNLNLLKRIEELTLYILQQEKRIQEIEKQQNFENNK